MTEKSLIGNTSTTVVEGGHPPSSINLVEFWRYRELLYFLVKRDIKVRYKQTILGGVWAVLQPFLTMIVFSFFFGRLAKMPSDGVPYPIFVFAGLLPWTYFANAIGSAGNSLVGSANLIRKVYFPRIIIPAGSSLAGLLDFFIASAFLSVLMVYYQVVPNLTILLIPLFVLLLFLCALGVGLWLSALNVTYRDVRYAIPFLLQIWLFLSPVIYPSNLLGHRKYIMSINPVSGIIEAFRAALLGHSALDWISLSISSVMTIILVVSGAYYFGRTERQFADIV